MSRNPKQLVITTCLTAGRRGIASRNLERYAAISVAGYAPKLSGAKADHYGVIRILVVILTLAAAVTAGERHLAASRATRRTSSVADRRRRYGLAQSGASSNAYTLVPRPESPLAPVPDTSSITSSRSSAWPIGTMPGRELDEVSFRWKLHNGN